MDHCRLEPHVELAETVNHRLVVETIFLKYLNAQRQKAPDMGMFRQAEGAHCA